MSAALNSSSIRNFQNNLHNAMCLLEGLPCMDLITAFRITLNLLERVAEIMQSQILVNKSEHINGNFLDTSQVTSLLTNCLERNDSAFTNGESQTNSNKSQIPPPNKLRINKRKQMPYKLQSPSTSKRFLTSFKKEEMKIADENVSDNNSSNFETCNYSAVSLSQSSIHDTTASPLKLEPSTFEDLTRDIDRTEKTASPNSSENHEVDVTGLDTGESPLGPVTPQDAPSVTDDGEGKIETSGDLRSQYERRQWRMFTSDKLNQLIDECEKVLDGKKIYKCKFCGKLYDIKSSMRYHMKIIHLQMHLRTDDMQCKNCGKRFTCVSAVNRHHAKCLLNNNTAAKPQVSPLTVTSSEVNTNGSPSSSVDVKMRRSEEEVMQYDTESPVDLSHSALQHSRC